MTEKPTALPDVNVLVALADPRHVHHEAAHRWFEGEAAFVTTPLTEVAFVRLMCHPKVGGETPATALELLRQVRGVSGHGFLPDDAALAEATVGNDNLIGHQQVTDMHLVNLAARHGLVLATFDARLWRSLPDADRRHVHLVEV
jgi:toxin-antitoxin system PIN domain toxin